MRIVICDVCRRQAIPPVETIGANGREFDVCGPCQDSPFRVPCAIAATVLLSPGSGVKVYEHNPEPTP